MNYKSLLFRDRRDKIILPWRMELFFIDRSESCAYDIVYVAAS